MLPHATVDEGHEHVVEVDTKQARRETAERENMCQTSVINKSLNISNAIHLCLLTKHEKNKPNCQL